MDRFKINMLDKVKELQQDDVVINDGDTLQSKLCSIIEDGPQQLQVLADFDSTLTRWSVNAVPAAHSIDIFQMTKGLTEAYLSGFAILASKYEPLLEKASLVEDRQQILWQWWDEHEALLMGEQINIEDIHRATDSANTPLREGTELMFHLLKAHEVPLTVISAGFGEVVEHSLKEFKPTIVSNFMTFDECRRIQGFRKPTVSVYNKHELKLPVKYDRHNVIVLGDSSGDSTMADGIADVKHCIKIGFLNENVKHKLKMYSSLFDIVLLNDQSMNIVNVLLQMILKSVGPTQEL